MAIRIPMTEITSLTFIEDEFQRNNLGSSANPKSGLTAIGRINRRAGIDDQYFFTFGQFISHLK